MKPRGLLIAALLLAALSGALYWSNHHPPKADASSNVSLNELPKILSLNQADVAQLSIRRKDQPALDLSRNDSGAWQITAPLPLGADQEAVSSLVSSLSSLNGSRLIEEKASNLAPYGLASPSLELDVTLKNKKEYKLLIGDQAPAGNSYYVKLADDPRLFSLAGYNETSLDKSASDLRDKRLLTADFDKVSQIELSARNSGHSSQIIFARNKDAWQVLKPKPIRTDIDQVEALIRSLKDAKMETAASDDEKKDAAAFNSASPFASAKVIGAAGTQELQVRKAKDDYYAKSSVVSGVYKISSTAAMGLDKTLEDFRNKKLFDFGYSEPDKIEIHDGSKPYFFTHSGSDWWGPDGKKLDDMTVQDLLGKLRDLEATKFPDSGFTSPGISITVVSDKGKRTEKVSIAKSGQNYIAKRDAEPDLYELSSSSVSDLQKAAADVKPAPPSPAKK